jgi:hypothetical protein
VLWADALREHCCAACADLFDGALCMEMLVDWQPTFGNVEALLVQICAFLAHSNARVKSLAGRASGQQLPPPAAAVAQPGGGEAVAGTPEDEDLDDAERQRRAQRSYESLKRFHDKKGWGKV